MYSESDESNLQLYNCILIWRNGCILRVLRATWVYNCTVTSVCEGMALPWEQRVCTVHLERKRGGGWCFFTQIEPNWPLPYSTVPVQWLRDARPTGWVTYCSICMRETMPRAQNRAGKGSILHIVKTIGFYHLVIIYLWCSHTKLTQWAVKSSSQLCKFNIYNVMLNVPRPPFTQVDEKEPISSDNIFSFILLRQHFVFSS